MADKWQGSEADKMTMIRGFVLAGGRSKRLGTSDKTRLEISGVPMVHRALKMALLVSSDVEVVADRWNRFSDLGISSLEDIGEDGPVAGWRRVLSSLRSGEVACLLPVDLTVFSPSWVARLLTAVRRTGRPSAFISRTHWVEPYPCLIPTGVDPQCLEEGMSLRAALRALKVMRVARPHDLADHPSLNTAQAFEQMGIRLN